MQPKESESDWHFYISLVKSIIRMGAGTALVFQQFVLSRLI